MGDIQTLVMFSGGKDSFLTVCRYLIQREPVGLLAFDNGSLAGTKCIEDGAHRLITRYGVKEVKWEGIYNTASLQRELSVWSQTATCMEVAPILGAVNYAQLQCLHCQTAMWVAAIAYATAKGYRRISSGYRVTDYTCMGSSLYLKQLQRVAQRVGVAVDFPLWHDVQVGEELAFDVEEELSQHGLMQTVCGPQCMIRQYTSLDIRAIEKDLDLYFESLLLPIVNTQLPRLREQFRHTQLFRGEVDTPKVCRVERGLY